MKSYKKIRSIFIAIVALTGSVLYSEVRLTLVNKTGRPLALSYSTRCWGAAGVTGDEYERVPLGYWVHNHPKRDASGKIIPAAFIAADQSHLLYHAGACSAYKVGLRFADEETRGTVPLIPGTDSSQGLYLKGARGEEYSMDWLYKQWWGDGPSWNWTLYVYAR